MARLATALVFLAVAVALLCVAPQTAFADSESKVPYGGCNETFCKSLEKLVSGQNFYDLTVSGNSRTTIPKKLLVKDKLPVVSAKTVLPQSAPGAY